MPLTVPPRPPPLPFYRSASPHSHSQLNQLLLLIISLFPMGGDMEASEKGSKSHTMWNPRKGGFRAAIFVFGMAALENVGFIANAVSLVMYFMSVMHFDLSGSATTLTNFMGSTFLLTILGGFVSDTYMTRLNTVLFFGVFEIAGYILLTIQAHYTNLEPCKVCLLEGRNAHLFYLTLCLLALGSGGVRGALPALGADQFNKSDPKERKQMASFFNWLLLCIVLGAALGVTVIVYVSTEKSWALGFFLGMILTVAGFFFVTVGKPFYNVRFAGDGPLIRVAQVFVVAIKNRNLPVPDSPEKLLQTTEREEQFTEEKIPHSKQFRFLDKAAVVPPSNSEPEPWKACSVTQVEEVKILIRMLPILASTIVMNTCLAQLQTFSVQQGNMMNLYLGRFKVPAPSIPVIPLLFMAVLIPLYEFAFVPLARKVTGHPAGITQLQRVGIGLVLSVFSMAAAAAVEVIRRNALVSRGYKISLFWLSFQYGIFGVADMFTLVGLMEFFYSEAPMGMRSLATSFAFLSLALGYFLSSVLVNSVNRVTGKGGRDGQGWLFGLDLDQNRLDLFYWFLAVLSSVNFVVYVLCARWYKYRKDGHGNVIEDAGVDREGFKCDGAQEKKDAEVGHHHDQEANYEGEVVEEDGEFSKVIEKEELMDELKQEKEAGDRLPESKPAE